MGSLPVIAGQLRTCQPKAPWRIIEHNQPAVVVSDGSVIPGLDPETGRELFCLAARVLTHARQTLIRFAPAMRAGRFQTAWDHLRALPATPSG